VRSALKDDSTDALPYSFFAMRKLRSPSAALLAPLSFMCVLRPSRPLLMDRRASSLWRVGGLSARGKGRANRFVGLNHSLSEDRMLVV
jgi:hypothetical protein